MTLAALLCVPLIAPSIRTAAFESPPGQVRPWATANFLELTAPVPSPGRPTDPQYTARHSGSVKSTNPNFEVSVFIESARVPFVPDYEVIEFDGAKGFSNPSGMGKVRWLAGKAFDLPPNWSDTGYSSELKAFHPDGSAMNGEEERALGIPRRELNSWGLEQEGVGGTAMIVNLGLQGFPNLQHHLRGASMPPPTSPSIRGSSSIQHRTGCV